LIKQDFPTSAFPTLTILNAICFSFGKNPLPAVSSNFESSDYQAGLVSVYAFYGSVF